MTELKPVGKIDEEEYFWFTDYAKYSSIPSPDKLYSKQQLIEKIREINFGPEQNKGLEKLLEEVKASK